MRQGMWRGSPALVVSALALFVALGGTVYAGARIDGRAIKPKTLPGNRLVPRSVPGNRIRPRSVPGNRLRPKSLPGNRLRPRSIGPGRLHPALLERMSLPLPLTGADINELTLGRVPAAARATRAGSAESAKEAETARTALQALDAQTVNGYGAGCLPGTVPFAGACWQASPSLSAATAPDAAESCAQQGGSLPEALQLAAFAKQPGVNLHGEDEWSSELPVVSGPDAYAVATVTALGVIDKEVSTETRHYRCVIPLVG